MHGPIIKLLGIETMEERTTAELIEILGSDYEHFHKEIIARIDEGTTNEDGTIDADYAFEARQLVRAAFSYIEAVTFSVKCTAANNCMDKNLPISDSERYFAVEVQYILNDKGEVIERPAQIRLSQNVRFAFNLLARSLEIEPLFDPKAEWWSCFMNAIKIRDRLMHPRMPEDLDIGSDELLEVMKAKHGFDDLLIRH